jgi:hypothetical protein
MIQNLTLKYAMIASFVIGMMLTISFGLYGYTYFDIYLHREAIGGIVRNIDLDESTTTIQYSTEDKTITKTLHFIDSGFKEEDEVVVYYDTRDESKSFIAEQLSIILYCFGLGIFFIGVFIVTFVLYQKKERQAKTKKSKRKK